MTEKLLAAIYKNPDDLAMRAVYADAIGGPRGELITLQLLEAPTIEQKRRMRTLIEKLGDALLPPIHHWFLPDDHVFDGGFFAGGSLRDQGRNAHVKLEREWATVRAIGAWGSMRVFSAKLLVALASNKALVGLRTIRGLDREDVLGLAHAKLRTVEWRSGGAWDPKKHRRLATLDELPALETIGILGANDQHYLKYFQEAEVVERVRRVIVDRDDQPKIIAALAERGGNLRELEIRSWPHSMRPPWEIVISRSTGDGPFDTLSANHAGRAFPIKPLVEALAAIPKGWLKSGAITSTRTTKLAPKDKTAIAAALKKHPKAKIAM